MKKYNLSEIMKRAWEIKNENSKNIFAICLKMAWEEAKKGESKLTVEEYNAMLLKIKNLEDEIKRLRNAK